MVLLVPIFLHYIRIVCRSCKRSTSWSMYKRCRLVAILAGFAINTVSLLKKLFQTQKFSLSLVPSFCLSKFLPPSFPSFHHRTFGIFRLGIYLDLSFSLVTFGTKHSLQCKGQTSMPVKVSLYFHLPFSNIISFSMHQYSQAC